MLDGFLESTASKFFSLKLHQIFTTLDSKDEQCQFQTLLEKYLNEACRKNSKDLYATAFLMHLQVETIKPIFLLLFKEKYDFYHQIFGFAGRVYRTMCAESARKSLKTLLVTAEQIHQTSYALLEPAIHTQNFLKRLSLLGIDGLDSLLESAPQASATLENMLNATSYAHKAPKNLFEPATATLERLSAQAQQVREALRRVLPSMHESCQSKRYHDTIESYLKSGLNPILPSLI